MYSFASNAYIIQLFVLHRTTHVAELFHHVSYEQSSLFPSRMLVMFVRELEVPTFTQSKPVKLK